MQGRGSPYKPPLKWQTLPTCHCEEQSDVAISQYYVGYHESSGENVTAFPRLHPKGTSSRFALRAPRRFAPRNDKSGSIAPLNSCHQYCQPAWRSLSAATDAIGRCVFIDTLHELEVPSRDCHVALLLAMTHQAGAAAHQCPPAVELPCTRRSLSAAAFFSRAADLYGSPQPTEKYPKFGNKGQNCPFLCHKNMPFFTTCQALFFQKRY